MSTDKIHPTISKLKIGLTTSAEYVYETVDKSEVLLQDDFNIDCKAKILCAIDEKYAWGNCFNLKNKGDMDECLRYQNVGMTRMICGCTYWNSADDNSLLAMG